MSNESGDIPLTPEQTALKSLGVNLFHNPVDYDVRYVFYPRDHDPRQEVHMLFFGGRIATFSQDTTSRYEELLLDWRKQHPTYIFDLPHEEQAKLLGKDISQDSNPEIVVELDQYTSQIYYGVKYTTVDIWLEMDPTHGVTPELHLAMQSNDDVCLNLYWEDNNLYEHPLTTIMDIRYWLQRTGYYVSVAGLKALCTCLGKFHDNSNGV